MKLLLHTCCGPCLFGPLSKLERDGVQVTAHFYNPNVMPYREFRARLRAFTECARRLDIPARACGDYQLKETVRTLLKDDRLERCAACYALRLNETARLASDENFDAFATTLAVSPYQNHELIRRIGLEAGEKSGVRFFYEDWRPLFEKGEEAAQGAGVYMQGYCGCVFSEEERYRPSVRKRLAKSRRARKESS